jgi:protein-tyrosine phosphatase
MGHVMNRVCFVCLGNICRSPTAEGVFRRLVSDAKLEAEFGIDSAGTAAYHVGELADSRARAAAHRRGYEITGKGRQFQVRDFDVFDYVLAADEDNLCALKKMAPNETARRKIHLLREYDPTAPAGAEVPDPYYGGPAGFDNVIDICERACAGLLNHIRSESIVAPSPGGIAPE